MLLTCAPLDTVRTGFIGVGMRGKDAAICDLEQKHIGKVQNRLISRGCAKAVEYIGEDSWKELCERDDIDLIYISTPWNLHVPSIIRKSC